LQQEFFLDIDFIEVTTIDFDIFASLVAILKW